MNISKLRASTIKLVDAYTSKLSNYSDDIFQTTPPINGWSYSEVYSHIFDSSLLSLNAIDSCIEGKGEIKSTPFIAKLLLFFGAFPPKMRLEVPKRLKERVKKLSKEEALKMINDFLLKLEKLYPSISSASSESKIKHPRLSHLNAVQWLRFIEIHLKHHLKQLDRIEYSFNILS